MRGDMDILGIILDGLVKLFQFRGDLHQPVQDRSS